MSWLDEDEMLGRPEYPPRKWVAGGHPAYVYRIRVFAGSETSVLYFISDLLETDGGMAILRVRLW